MIHEPDLSAETRIWGPPPVCEPAPDPEPTRAPKSRLWPVQTFLCALLCAGVLLCKVYSPAATEALADLVIGTGESRLRTAVACFETALDGGGSVGNAISVFCDEIITP